MKLPVVSGSDAVKAFGRAGYEFDEQHGSHIILRQAGPPHRTALRSQASRTCQRDPSSVDSGGRAYRGRVRKSALISPVERETRPLPRVATRGAENPGSIVVRCDTILFLCG